MNTETAVRTFGGITWNNSLKYLIALRRLLVFVRYYSKLQIITAEG
jgi:hypothetical protein